MIFVSQKQAILLCALTYLMHSDVNDGDLLSVTNYINAEGLSGTYQLYIQIDGNVYKINQKVTF